MDINAIVQLGSRRIVDGRGQSSGQSTADGYGAGYAESVTPIAGSGFVGRALLSAAALDAEPTRC